VSSHHAAATPHVHRDDVGSRMGMWIFLFTELILFGGLFIVYAVYRFQFPDEFKLAAKELDTLVGALNTIVLLTSSLTMALSITAIAKGSKKLALFFSWTTLFLGLVFLVNKYFEWGHKFEVGIYPQSAVLTAKSNGEILYFGLYYTMTGLHALHVIIGMVIIAFNVWFIARNVVHQHSYVKLENAGLYWHLVDIIWIYLFPLFYLLH